MSQLTLTLDDDLLKAAQAYARQHGQPLDALVAGLLKATVQPAAAPAQPTRPLSARIQRLAGSLQLPAGFDYRTELENALTERFGQGL